jgi:hypothetical protein
MLQAARVPAWLRALRQTLGSSELDRRARKSGVAPARLNRAITGAPQARIAYLVVHLVRTNHIWEEHTSHTVRSVGWLFGAECDEMMPGWGGNMWFAVWTAALIARDKAKRWRPYVKWPPDIELSEDKEFSAASCPPSISDDPAVLEDA